MSGASSPGAATAICLLGMIASAWSQTSPYPATQPKTPAPTPRVGGQFSPAGPEVGRLPADKRYMPSSISEPLMSMTIQVVKEGPGKSIYRSKHFEFTTPVKLGVNSMTQICRAFESTHELVSKLPWGITPWPEDGQIFHAQLFMTRDDYLKSGAPEWSAGVYSPNDKMFRIPFEEVGLRSRGNEFFLGGPINNEVITHEVTHQMMHDYLRFMPIWMAEGLAEYTAHLPYDSGRYNVANAVDGYKKWCRDYGKSKKPGVSSQPRRLPPWAGTSLWAYTTSVIRPRLITSFEPDPPATPRPQSTGVTVTQSIKPPGMLEYANLPSVYFSAHAMVFYLMHLDGDGKATRLKRYFDAIHDERNEWAGFDDKVAEYDASVDRFQKEVVQYRAEWEAFKKLPGVQIVSDTELRYPANLTPPKSPTPPVRPVGPRNTDPTKVCAKHTDVLLDGRTPEAMDKEIRAAFARVEIPLQ